jgi:hypothetical protein
MDKTSLYQDSMFRKIVVGSTGLGLACMLGSVAAVRISKGSGLQFGWHWTILLVAAAVIVWNMRFWNVVWELQDRPNVKTKKRLALHLGILCLLGIGSFLYPIRYIEQSYFSGIAKGLVTALTFLGTMFWLIYKCGKGLAAIDAAELQRQSEAANASGQ